MNNFNQFQTKKRIIMMGKSKSTPMQRLRFLTLIPVVGVLLFVFSCEKENIEPNLSQLEEFPETLVIPFENPVNTFQNASEVFDIVEEQPNPQGGIDGWNTYLAKNLQYPLEAREKGIQGTVIVVFEIHKDGSIHNVEILRGIGGGADEEAVRVVQNAPNWAPGKQRGREVITRMRLPIRFQLEKFGDSNSTITVNALKEKPYDPSGHLQELAVIGYVPSID
jgi:TonB family protein